MGLNCNEMGLKDSTSVNPESTLADLGLDSLMGVEVKQTLERDFDMNLSNQEIRLLTFSKLKQISQGSGSSGSKSPGDADVKTISSAILSYDLKQMMPAQPLIKLNDVKDGEPLFVVHPIEGNSITLKKFAPAIQRPVYGLQCTLEAPLDSIEKLASFYIYQIQSHQPAGPYTLSGYSFGSIVAVEMALQLQRAGVGVRRVVLLDGSHSFITAYTAQQRVRLEGKQLEEREAVTMCGFITQFKDIDYQKVYSELQSLPDFKSRLEKTAQLLTPEITSSDVTLAARSFHDKLVAAVEYHPAGKLTNDVTLIKAKDGLEPTKILGEDYGLKDVCEGTVHVETVDGNHVTFLQTPKTAQLVNSTISQS